jgi:hypothetical protein
MHSLNNQVVTIHFLETLMHILHVQMCQNPDIRIDPQGSISSIKFTVYFVKFTNIQKILQKCYVGDSLPDIYTQTAESSHSHG